mmetsp:Transcript_14572/g.20784  ORF Transcript_14572/g.20784 Transcript_14572/m.20784 type:complete len:448 (+) Transcript_14572:78-1421(+)
MKNNMRLLLHNLFYHHPLFVVLLVNYCLQNITIIHGFPWAFDCSLDDNVVIVRYDSETGTFSKRTANENNNNNNPNNKTDDDNNNTNTNGNSTRPLSNPSRTRNLEYDDSHNKSSEILTEYYARECTCGEKRHYCPRVVTSGGVANNDYPQQQTMGPNPYDSNINACSASFEKETYCFYRSPFQRTLIFALWPLTYFSFIFVFISFFTTNRGMHTRHYIMNKLCRHRHAERLLVENTLDREREARQMVIQGIHIAQNPSRRNDVLAARNYMRRHTSFRLRVKKYKSPHTINTNTHTNNTSYNNQSSSKTVQSENEEEIISNNNNNNNNYNTHSNNSDTVTIACFATTTTTTTSTNNEYSDGTTTISNSEHEEVSCTICMAPFQHADRVGDLKCNHLFHIECLKEWVKWRNVCPLCQEPDIATEHVTFRSNDPNGDISQHSSTANGPR